MQHKDLTGYKLFLSAIGGFFLDCIGGWDNEMAFLLCLIGVDIFTGILKAIKQKSLSSTSMRDGLFKKSIIILIIVLAVRGDLVIKDFFGHPIMWNDHELYLRTAFCLWFMLEELISIVENCAILNVPLPRWLRDILLQVNDGINATTPTQVISIAKKLFGNKTNSTGITEETGSEDSGSDNTLLEDSTNADK